MGKNLESMYFVSNTEGTQLVLSSTLGCFVMAFPIGRTRNKHRYLQLFLKRRIVERTGYVTTNRVCGVVNIDKTSLANKVGD